MGIEKGFAFAQYGWGETECRGMKVALAQINPTVGDLAGNQAKILSAYRRGAEAGADVVMFPELAVTGYPPRDLLLKKSFIAGNLKVLDQLAAATGRTALLTGYVGENSHRPGREVTNAVALLQHGKIVATRVKSLLPTYDVFDEDRYFEPATENLPVEFNGGQVGLTICEDIWNDEDFWTNRRYRSNPPVELAAAGARAIFNISASPWSVGKEHTRYRMLQSMAAKAGRAVVFCNQAGGNDELIFDGGSVAFNAAGELIAQAAMFAEDFVLVDTESAAPISRASQPDEENIHNALVLGLGDYLHKCGFKSAVLGLSGGIDSALVACLAVAALGRENVRGVSLPSEYSSPGSLADARALAGNLGIQYEVIPIQSAFATVKEELEPAFAGRPEDTTEENIQARLRGVILMALSNKFGSLLLTTGQQERTGRRLLHAIRRHVRRAGGDQRRAEDDGVSAGEMDQPRARNHSGRVAQQAAFRGIASEPDGPGFAAALRDSRRHSGRVCGGGEDDGGNSGGGVRGGDGETRDPAD